MGFKCIVKLKVEIKVEVKLSHLDKLTSLAKWLSVFVYELSVCGFEYSCSHLNFRYGAYSVKEFLEVQATFKWRFTQYRYVKWQKHAAKVKICKQILAKNQSYCPKTLTQLRKIQVNQLLWAVLIVACSNFPLHSYKIEPLMKNMDYYKWKLSHLQN